MKQTQTQRLAYLLISFSGLVATLIWIQVAIATCDQLLAISYQTEVIADFSVFKQTTRLVVDTPNLHDIPIPDPAPITSKPQKPVPKNDSPSVTATVVSPQETVPTIEQSELVSWGLTRNYTLSIPSLSVRTPVLRASDRYWSSRDWTNLEEQLQTAMQYGAVAYPHSSNFADRGGAMYIAGHSSPPDERAKSSAYGHLFASLPSIASGEEILLHKGSSKSVYEVISTRVVPASYTHILAEGSPDSITLITCYPVGTTTERFVVSAKKVFESDQVVQGIEN